EPAVDQDDQALTKRPLKLLIIIGLVVVLISVGAAFFLLTGDAESDDVAVVPENPEAIYFALTPKFKTNYQVNGRPRLFQIGITLVAREQDVIDALMTHGPSIKSRLVILLSGQQVDSLQTPEGRESLRAECLAAVQAIMNKEIGKPGIEKILFTDFVMQ
ncbi:MAG: flagellar basal body-associated FliL family protein, partial [Pseudomonadales bacterium]